MNTTPVLSLDFFEYRNSLKTFLQGQDKFKDFNFEGSNMSVLLDLLAYNTFQNAYYTNISLAEMFADSAQLENSVVSHAKELNYLPRSFKSAKAEVVVSITSDSTVGNSISIPALSKFSTNYSGQNFVFFNQRAAIASRVGTTNLFETECIEIYEGEGVQETFVITNANKNVVLTNENVDTDSISVEVNGRPYVFKSGIFGLRPEDEVFFVEPHFDGKYKVTFGNGSFGVQPVVGSTVVATYRTSSGDAANGASRFSISNFTNARVVTETAAFGGTDRETIESIKFFAPKSIQVQERAITADDYEVLLKQRFSDIKAISVYGGEDLTPPQFGKVAISVNLFGDAILSEGNKTYYKTYLSNKTPLTIEPVFVNPEFMFASVNVEVNFNPDNSTKSATQIRSDVLGVISNYNDNNLSEFGSILRISKLSAMIDALDNGIVGNTILVNPIIEIAPQNNVAISTSLKFSTALIKPYPFSESLGVSNYTPAIKSSVFLFDGVNAFLQDDGNGKLQIVSANESISDVVSPDVGSVNYETGEVIVSNLTVQDYVGNAIKITANTISRNINSPKTRILEINDSDVTISIIEVNE